MRIPAYELFHTALFLTVHIPSVSMHQHVCFYIHASPLMANEKAHANNSDWGGIFLLYIHGTYMYNLPAHRKKGCDSLGVHSRLTY